MEVGETTSICRFVRTTPQVVQTNDPIAGYDYIQRRTHVTICGDFDLDADGIATAPENERFAALVRQWGFEIDNDVDFHTKYLIVGQRPPSPGMNDPPPVVVPGDVVDQRTKDQKRYDQLIEDAKRHAVPVLNMNRTLKLIAYYDKTIAMQ